ncbi:MAG: hypothetical protein HQK53_03985 [Oligoflexia bacterium]|nr:hypothetical protein [Oligoflexia bacterium]
MGASWDATREAYRRYLVTIRNSIGENNYCFRDLHTDWSATSRDDFIISSGQAKSSTEYGRIWAKTIYIYQ